MSKINFTFYQNRRKGANTPPATITPIHCEVVYLVNGDWKRFRFSTGEKCAIRHFKNQKVFHTVNFATQINNKLEVLQRNGERIYRDALETGMMPHPDKFKEMILDTAYKVQVERDLLSDYEAFIEYHQGKGTTKSSLSHILNLRKHLEQFAQKQRLALTYENINLDFYGKFLRFLRTYKHAKAEAYAENTVGNYIKKLKMFLNWSKANGWNKHEYYLHPDFKILENPVGNIYLEQFDLDALLNLDLKKRPYLNDTRNWFLLACETGMRYSDYKQLHKSNLKEVVDGYDFNYEPRKTSKSSKMRVTVPLSGNVIHILLQYGFDMPRPVSNQKMNKGLKELATLCGIDKIIGTHTARRTFATLRYKDGLLPVQAIMKITGHRTEKEFYKYLCIEGEENAAMFRQKDDRYNIKVSGLLEGNLRVA